jgi:hypothetical protein
MFGIDIFSAFVPRIRQSYGRIGCLKYSTGAPAGEGKRQEIKADVPLDAQ